MTRKPGEIRDSILSHLGAIERDASISEITNAVESRIGPVSQSSVRSFLNLNAQGVVERTQRGRYRLRDQCLNGRKLSSNNNVPVLRLEGARLFHADCFDWLAAQEPCSIHAVVTDPPYGLVEYSDHEQEKLRNGKGGVWRIPPSFDGHQRSPLPRFTTLSGGDIADMRIFFDRLGKQLMRVLVPGANVLVASNPLLAHVVANSMSRAGLEMRGTIVRRVMTMRGGDRPKNAHDEFPDVSVLPRSMFEPWVMLRKPLDGRVQDNLRRWGTGGFRRPTHERPFGDVIESHPTPTREKKIAPHPSLKPQAFLRQLVRACLPLGSGTVLDPFAGSGSTLAAAIAIGYESVGVERDPNYVRLAQEAVLDLSRLGVKVDPVRP